MNVFIEFISLNSFDILVSFNTQSTFAVSIYSLFYLLYIFYPNNLRRELHNEIQQSTNNNDKSQNRLAIEKILLVKENRRTETKSCRWNFSFHLAFIRSFQTSSEFCLQFARKWKSRKSMAKRILATIDCQWRSRKREQFSNSNQNEFFFSFSVRRFWWHVDTVVERFSKTKRWNWFWSSMTLNNFHKKNFIFFTLNFSLKSVKSFKCAISTLNLFYIRVKRRVR